MEAQRYPDDFDGILAGSPANFWTHLFVGFVWDQQALEENPASYIPASSLPILSNAALKQCVGKDGGVSTDTFLNDPRQCRFKPADVVCKNGQSSGCLTPAQVTAAQKIYRGPANPTDDVRIYPGYSPTEGTESNLDDWPAWIIGTSPGTGAQEIFGDQFFTNMVFDNPRLNYENLNLATDVATADWKMRRSQLDQSRTEPVPRARRKADPVCRLVGRCDLALQRCQLLQQRGADEEQHGRGRAARRAGQRQTFYRLFIAPGMAHCGGGKAQTFSPEPENPLKRRTTCPPR